MGLPCTAARAWSCTAAEGDGLQSSGPRGPQQAGWSSIHQENGGEALLPHGPHMSHIQPCSLDFLTLGTDLLTLSVVCALGWWQANGHVAVADLGGSVISGIDGNPLAVLSKQLQIPMHQIQDSTPFYLADGTKVKKRVDNKVRTALSSRPRGVHFLSPYFACLIPLNVPLYNKTLFANYRL